MLHSKDSESVLKAFKLVLERTQESVAGIEKFNGDLTPEQSLKAVCKQVCVTFGKIETIKKHCDYLNGIPEPIDEIIEAEFGDEDSAEQKARIDRHYSPQS